MTKNRLLTYLADYPGASFAEIATYFGGVKNVINNRLHYHFKMGAVERRGKRGKYRYYIAGQAPRLEPEPAPMPTSLTPPVRVRPKVKAHIMRRLADMRGRDVHLAMLIRYCGGTAVELHDAANALVAEGVLTRSGDGSAGAPLVWRYW